jgi:hypothetical protein
VLETRVTAEYCAAADDTNNARKQMTKATLTIRTNNRLFMNNSFFRIRLRWMI